MSLSTLEVFKHIQPEGAVVLTDEQLLDLQKTLNGILRDIVSVCAKHHLQYFLGGGSALGAIRHHGFIPWDDDIDINMPREDHDRFVQVFRQEFGTKYWVHTPEETAGYGLLLSRVLLKGTSVRTREDFHNPECGAFIDIFVIENTERKLFSGHFFRLLRLTHGSAGPTAGTAAAMTAAAAMLRFPQAADTFTASCTDAKISVRVFRCSTMI